ncbi:hypothetical protein CesoFtcFv8_009621 [Champsocephalus esox]|uniref:C2H2-type domain-containing protein n=1 Tax=Champsocephalus esox TaxID=159716 RepID=A0AAN8C435_9TELE|nr:hypothetical protein CesoFtcFv8_009621 [Champsocephalus esox]
MAAQTLFPVFPADGGHSELPPPQLVMLANVAAAGEAEEEKEMMELKTVGCSYSDSEEESIIRYSYDDQNHREVCIVEYPESPRISSAVAGDDSEEIADKAEEKAEDLPAPPLPDGTKKKKPFHCKPCRFQASSEREFVEHLGSHGASKMRVVDRVEGRSRGESWAGAEGETTEGEGESGGEGDVKGLIRCERCGYNTNRYDHYIAHLKHHSKEGEDHRVFKCTLCPYTTVSQYHWRKHLRNHFPSKLHTCSQCSYFSDRKSNYIQHIRTHTGVRPFQCLYCDYSSSQKTHLTRHMRTHSGERPFKCETCNYLAANQHEVTRHARQVHNGPKPLSCPYCEYKTADRSNYKKHVELHLNPRQFVCPLCKYAASKKCNLQYHLKSRHAGCSVVLDVSKVKLRNKKHGHEDTAESSTGKTDHSSGVDEDEVDEVDEESSPINLSIKPNANQPLPSEARQAPDKAPKKPTSPPETEKVLKGKAEPEKKVTRQKKNLLEKETPVPEKAKRRVKKPPVEKTTAKDPAAGSGEPQRPEEDEERVPERKRNKGLSKPRKSASKKSEKPEPAKEPEPSPVSPEGPEPEPSPVSPEGPEPEPSPVSPEGPEPEPSPVSPEGPQKERSRKRKAVEALDLSKKSSSETPSKTRRGKRPASEETKKTSEATRAPRGSNGTSPGNTRKTNKSSDLQQTLKAEKDQKTSSSKTGTTSSKRGTTSSKRGTKSSKPGTTSFKPGTTSSKRGTTSSKPGTTSSKPCLTETTSSKRGTPCEEEEEGPRSKPSDAEEDEGVHSSLEGGSDISDSASEGSDDSGLNGARSGKMANDPETPTDEIPTPTELKSHLCIFCDRTFPLEVVYRRHLNRHLVNVYYMHDGTARAQT